MTASYPATLDEADLHLIPLPHCASEREFATKVLGCLEPWFKIEREVSGTHVFGRRARIDAVLQPHDASGWFDTRPAFGIEFKRFEDPSTRNRMRLAAQAVDYTYVEWNGYGRLGVFMCATGHGVFADSLITHFLGQFTVGELSYLRHYGWTLRIHGHHRLWSEEEGIREARYRTLIPKVGSR